jgi:lysophospholipase L1-like esterase
VARSHARGLRVIGGTLTPFKGCLCYSAREEVTRQAVNDWIRTSGTFDAVVDFDAALRDPDDPKRLLPAYDSGDHLHPGDAGYAAMGNAVDLSVL